jgi:PHS family inorganic phosphate transporter-like MFS transporter
VWAVAATGFFTDSYNLFASNIILPCLAFVYWGSEHEANIEITTNALTLAGSVVGQLIFGFLADKYGRQRLYGVELMIVIFSTIGLVSQAQRNPLVSSSLTIPGAKFCRMDEPFPRQDLHAGTQLDHGLEIRHGYWYW